MSYFVIHHGNMIIIGIPRTTEEYDTSASRKDCFCSLLVKAVNGWKVKEVEVEEKKQEEGEAEAPTL